MSAYIHDNSADSKNEEAIDLKTEINNLMQISQVLETFPMTGSNNQIGFGSCIKSLNTTIGNLIKYTQKECGGEFGTDKTS